MVTIVGWTVHGLYAGGLSIQVVTIAVWTVVSFKACIELLTIEDQPKMNYEVKYYY